MSAETRGQLRKLLRTRAVLHGDFVLSSGRRSSYYLDARRVTLSAAGAALIGDAFLDALSDLDLEAVAGLAIGADPIVASIAAAAGRSGRDIDGLIVRKERKEHGAGRRIEGPWREELRVAVVEDTLTTGASSLQAAQAVEEEGGKVVIVCALIDREQGAREAIEKAGYPFRTLFRASELIDP